jgi:hypothetical protein
MFHLPRIGGVAALLLLLSPALPARAADSVSAKDLQEIRAVFLRQAEAATAHDIDGIDAVLAQVAPGQPDPVSFVARAYTFWGREAVMEHFRAIFRGTWRFEPDRDGIRIIPLGADTAHIFAPTRITLDVRGAPATVPFLMEEMAIRTPAGWRIATIIPVPAP